MEQGSQPMMPQQIGKGQYQTGNMGGGQDNMQNLIQVQSLNMQQQQMVGATLGGNGGLGMNMGGVLIDSRFAPSGQMQ